MNAFLECGWAAWLILLLTIVALVGGLVGMGLAIFKPKFGLVFGAVATALALGVPACGVIGTMQGRSVVDDAVSGSSIDPSQRERIREVGYAEAATCTSLGLGFGALPWLLSLAAVGVAFARRRSRPSPDASPLHDNYP